MEDRHKKIRRKLYYLIPLVVLSGLLGILAIGGLAIGGLDIVGVFLLTISIIGFVFSFIKIRNIALDLQEKPAEAEGLLKDKKIRSSEHSTSYYLSIDALEFEFRCGLNEWRLADEGDRVRIIYHRHSKSIESIIPINKETGEEVEIFQHAWSKADGRCQCMEIIHGHRIPCNKELNKDTYKKAEEGGWVEDFLDSIKLGFVCWDCYNWRAETEKRRLQSKYST